MVNVLDTHRMQYRNAVLRAYDADNPTTRIDFFNGNVNIGNEVYTNENGYLFYEAGGRQPIENLNVNGSAIIKVSLDDGHHFGITWQVEDNTGLYVEESDVHDMTYRGSDNTRKTWQPLQADCALPDYLLKSEYHDGIWGEQEIAIGTDTTVITFAEWAHAVTILSTAPNNIRITNPRLRAGQIVTITVKKDCTLAIVTGAGAPVNHQVYKDHTYLLFNMYVTESTDAGVKLIDVTYNPMSGADVETLAKAAVPVRKQKNIAIQQTEFSQHFDLTSEFDNGITESPVYIHHYAASNYGNMSIKLPSASFAGTAEIVLDLNYDDITVGPTVNIQAYNSNIISITVPSAAGQYVYHLKLIAWYNQYSNRQHKLILET